MANIFKTLAVAAVAAGVVAVVPVAASATTTMVAGGTINYLGNAPTNNSYFWQSAFASSGYTDPLTGNYTLPASGTLDFYFTAVADLGAVGAGIATPASDAGTGYIRWYNGNSTSDSYVQRAFDNQNLFANFNNGDTRIFEIHWDSMPSSETLQANVSTVPVPATGLLLLGGIGAFGALRRRKKKATA